MCEWREMILPPRRDHAPLEARNPPFDFSLTGAVQDTRNHPYVVQGVSYAVPVSKWKPISSML